MGQLEDEKKKRVRAVSLRSRIYVVSYTSSSSFIRFADFFPGLWDAKGAGEGEGAKAQEEEEAGEYELASVLVHVGGSTGGHYYALIRPPGLDHFLEFNDSTVTPVTDEKVLAACGCDASVGKVRLCYLLSGCVFTFFCLFLRFFCFCLKWHQDVLSSCSGACEESLSPFSSVSSPRFRRPRASKLTQSPCSSITFFSAKSNLKKKKKKTFPSILFWLFGVSHLIWRVKSQRALATYKLGCAIFSAKSNAKHHLLSTEWG